MATKTDAQLTTDATQVKNEGTAKANTATRIGTLLNNINENKINKDKIATVITGTSDINVASEKAVKDYADGKEALLNKSANISTDTGSNVKYPSVKAVEDAIALVSPGFKKQTLADAATITLNHSLGVNFFSIASLAATRNLVLTNVNDKDFGVVVIGATNGFKLVFNSVTLNLPASGSATVSFVVDGANVIWEITPTITVSTTPGATYDTNAQTYFTALAATDGTVTTPQKIAYNKMVVDLKAANLYTKFTRIFTPLGGTANSHAIDAISSTSKLTYTPTVIHTAAGITVDNANAGTPTVSTNDSNSILNAGNFIFFIKLTENTLSAFNGYDFGGLVAPSDSFAFSARVGSDELKVFAAAPSPFVIANTSTIGLWAVAAKTTNELRVYKNGTSFLTDATARTGTFGNQSMYLSGLDATNANSAGRNIAFVAYGTGLTGTEVVQANTIITTFLAAI